MYRLFTGLLCLMVICSCATSSKTYTSNGQEGFNISCSSIFLTWGSCYKKAGDICRQRGYLILEKSGGIGATMSVNQSDLYGSSNRSMIIKCKD